VEEHNFRFEAEVWRYDSKKSSWFFVTLPVVTAEQIRFLFPLRRGFGSIPVNVQVGKSRWKTSIFPDKQSGSFVLPLKAQVRLAEAVHQGDRLPVEIVVRP